MNKLEVKELEKNKEGANYKIKYQIPVQDGFIDNVYFNASNTYKSKGFKLHFKEIEEDYAIFETTIFLPTCAVYKTNVYYECNKTPHEEKQSNLSVNFEVPDWAKGKIMYHIFVDRFCKDAEHVLKPMPRRQVHQDWNEEMIIGPDEQDIWNNDFYGGSLKGITSKLDYIKSLGVTIIYLSPVVTSQSNHRYDAADYKNVDPYLGTNKDLKELCKEAHSKGMKIVLDAVFNHTGDDSKYFNRFGTYETVGAFQSQESPYYSMYKKYHDFEYWWGMPNLPVCNQQNPTWKNYILGEGGVIDGWFKLGIDGLRLDVADELSDEFIEGIRIASHRNKPDSFIIGEVWKNPMRMGRGYLESGKGMDSVMNYHLVDAAIRYFKYADVDKLARVIKEIRDEYPIDTINSLMNFTSTHDISRAINIFGSDEFNYYSEWAWNPKNDSHDYCKNNKLNDYQKEQGKNVLMAYSYLMMLMPGIFSIFYGDEVGLEGLGNLANRKTMPWNKENQDLLEFYRFIGNIRNNEKFLETADLKIIDINQDYILFERFNNEERICIAVNRTGEIKTFKVPEEYQNQEGVYSLKKSLPGQLNPYGAVSIKSK